MKRKAWLWVVLLMICKVAFTSADTSETIFADHQSLSPADQEWKFNVSPFSIEHQVRLSLEARIDWPNLAGSNPWLRVAVNGNFLTREHLLNKRNEFKVQNGLDMNWVTGDRWRILYSPDFEAAIKNKDDAMAAPNDDPYRFVWDITSLVKPGENVVKLYNLKLIAEPTTMVFRNAQVEVGRAIAPPPAEVVAPAPTGPLPLFVATGKTKRVPMRVALAGDGGLQLNVAGKQFEVATRTSLPNGKWRETTTGDAAKRGKPVAIGQKGTVNWETDSYTVRREVTVLDDHIHISDTLTNPGRELIGVMVRHYLNYPSTPTSLLVAGRNAQPGTPSSLQLAEHPSVYAQWPDLGLGIVAEDDVFRVHIKSFNDAEGMGIADEQLGINPGSSVTLEWSIYPTPQTSDSPGDYWDFVNAVRRNWGSNFTIPGPFAFVPRFKPTESPEWYRDWVRSQGVKIIAGSIATFPDHKYAHGTGIMFAPQWIANERQWIQKLRSATPDVKTVAYFHAQLTTEPNATIKYADSLLRNDQGEHIGYPFEYPMPLFLPTRENSYGKALWGYVRTCLDDMGVDGLYWDEMTYSVLKDVKHGPWDNHTVVIDPKTHAVVGKRSNVQLLMQPLQLDIIRHLQSRKKYLMANAQPMTRTILREKIVRFVETQSYQSLANTHFGSPIGLGNHFHETSQADTARHIRDMLGHGALYYADTVYQKQPPTWPFVSTMFPITPVELRQGMVIGAERIQTARSGRFGWPDGAAAEVYIIDAGGNRVANPPVKEVLEQGRRVYEVRIPSDHFAVLVKKANP